MGCQDYEALGIVEPGAGTAIDDAEWVVVGDARLARAVGLGAGALGVARPKPPPAEPSTSLPGQARGPLRFRESMEPHHA